jgi:prophage regulatory protein
MSLPAPAVGPAGIVLLRSADPATLPATGFLHQHQVLGLIPVSKSTLWRRVGTGAFPAPVHLFDRVTVWRVEDVRAWIAAQSMPAAPGGAHAAAITPSGAP